MANSQAFRYYTNRTVEWMLNNKMIVFLSALSFCLIISTWAMAAQRNRAYVKIDDLTAQLATTAGTTPTNPEGNGTPAPDGGDGTPVPDGDGTPAPNEVDGTPVPDVDETPVPDEENGTPEEEPAKPNSENKELEKNDDESKFSDDIAIKNMIANSKLLSLLA